MLGTQRDTKRRVRRLIAGAAGVSLLFVGTWSPGVSADDDQGAETPPTTVEAVATTAPPTTVIVAVGQPPVPTPPTTTVAVGQPPVPPPTGTTVVAVGQPPVPPVAAPTPLVSRPVIRVTSTRVVEDAIDSLSDQLAALTALL